MIMARRGIRKGMLARRKHSRQVYVTSEADGETRRIFIYPTSIALDNHFHLYSSHRLPESTK